MKCFICKFSAIVFIFVLSLTAFSVSTDAQKKMDRIDRERAMSMLKNVRNAIKDKYYDPTFKGIDIDARFAEAETKIKAAETLGQAFGIIAQAVMDLNDSHTRFYPPARNYVIDYGWRMRMFGDACLVTIVDKKSDAGKKGLEVGDQVLSINKFPPSRNELWKVIYYYQTLSPQTKLALQIKKPDGTVKDLVIEAEITQLKAVVNLGDSLDFNQAVREGDKDDSSERHLFRQIGNATIWKMPSFGFAPGEVDRLIGEAKGKSALILDLRGNPGGYVVTLEKLAGYFFEENKKIADLKGRKKEDPQMAKTEGSKVFKGKVVVMLDSSSGSAAEIFGRLMQLEGRGIVVGDTSAGAVMQSDYTGFDAGSETSIQYGMNLTHFDVIMSDGKSIEHVGVVPDIKVIPTGADLASQRDPVLAEALKAVGITMTPDEAGKLFEPEVYVRRTNNLAFRFDF